jgi:AcrR family transcriptional regulator
LTIQPMQTTRSTAALAAPARRPRRSHAERSGETRHKLCESALQLLSEVGYERVTTASIAQHAQVSKGAQTHHFPTKVDILAAAFEHLLDGWKERRVELIDQHQGQPTLEETLRYLWREVFNRPDYIAAIELMLAARHDAPLRTKLQTTLATWTVARDDMFRRVAGLDGDLEKASTFLRLNFCVLRGMAIYDGLNSPSDHNESVLELWISMAKQHLKVQA